MASFMLKRCWMWSCKTVSSPGTESSNAKGLLSDLKTSKQECRTRQNTELNFRIKLKYSMCILTCEWEMAVKESPTNENSN